MIASPSLPFATMLKQHRQQRKLSQEELAERAQLSVRAVSDLERGLRQMPHRETVALLSAALHLAEEERRLFEAAARIRKRLIAGPRATPAPAPHNLPRPLTEIIGRAEAISALQQMLCRPGVQLLTLTGAGGVGKTRLAIEVAWTLRTEFADGVFLVPLAHLRDPVLALAALLRAVGGEDAAGSDALAGLAAQIGDKRLLVVLDNMEQVAAAGALVVEALGACAGLRVLATSRSALRVRGEHLYAVAPLPLPAADERAPVATVAQNPAVQVFVQRATAAQASFALTAANTAAVAEICRRLDGLPLALELAAARIGVLPPQDMVQRLQQGQEVAVGGWRDSPARQHTLRNTIAWSYDLLSPNEQALLRQLSVFAGGWSREAAEELWPREAVIDGLASLVDQSLIYTRLAADETARFGMLDTIRAFAAEQLEAMGEAGAVRARHAAMYLELAEQAEARLHGAEQGLWLARLENEHDNLRVALSWALGRADGSPGQLPATSIVTGPDRATGQRADQQRAGERHAVGMRLGGALWQFWWMRGHLQEGRRWLDEVLVADPTRNLARVKALHGAGVLAMAHEDHERAKTLLSEGLDLARELGDAGAVATLLCSLGNVTERQGYYVEGYYAEATVLYEESVSGAPQAGDSSSSTVMRALGNQGIITMWTGDFARAAAHFEQCLTAARAVGDTWGIVTTLLNLGIVYAHLGDFARAQEVMNEALRQARALGAKLRIMDLLNNLGNVAIELADYAQAEACFDECWDLACESGKPENMVNALTGLAFVAHQQGDVARSEALYDEAMEVVQAVSRPIHKASILKLRGDLAHEQGRVEQAGALLRESVALTQAAGNTMETLTCLSILAAVALAQGQPERAVQLCAASTALRTAAGTPCPPTEHRRLEPTLAAARTALSAEAFTAAWAAGQALTLEQAVAVATTMSS